MELSWLERYTLLKALKFLKFGCNDIESKYFAGSPILGNIMTQLVLGDNSENFLDLNKDTKMNNIIYSGTIKNLERTIEWNGMDEESKISHIKNLLLPYFLDEDKILGLVKITDNYHNEGNRD